MQLQLLQTQQERDLYHTWLEGHAERSLWQSDAWRTFQEALGRKVRIYAAVHDGRIIASALTIIDRTRGGLITWDIPRGPLWSRNLVSPTRSDFLASLVDLARAEKALSLTCSPLAVADYPAHFRPSGRTIQPEATRIIPLTGTDDEILGQMKQKGRYNIHLAEKHGIRIERSRDADLFAAIAKKTGQRDNFISHSARHYRTFIEALPGSFLLLAYEPETPTPIAGIIGAAWQKRGIYYYGASDHAKRQLMAPYLLQWEAMKHCKAAGCTDYDLFGIAPPAATNHPWAGISDFKAKFGGRIEEYPPEQQITLRPIMHSLLAMKRRIVG